MYVRAGRPAFARVGVHKSTSLMNSSLLVCKQMSFGLSKNKVAIKLFIEIAYIYIYICTGKITHFFIFPKFTLNIHKSEIDLLQIIGITLVYLKPYIFVCDKNSCKKRFLLNFYQILIVS